MKARVLVVDDSAVVRGVVSRELARDPEIDVVGTAANADEAREAIRRLRPNVLTLDVEMPGMDGLTFLKEIMRDDPIPVIVVSSYTERGSSLAIDALAAGGVDVLCKPAEALRIPEITAQLRELSKAAAGADLDRCREAPLPVTPLPGIGRSTCSVIAIGASTGGPQAIAAVLARLPDDAPGVLVVQHMPPRFTSSFAEHLDRELSLRVKEAETGDRVEPGTVLIAPGDRHLVLQPGLAVDTKDGPLVSRHRPSVDVLFRSVAAHAGSDAIGVILTGMGADGAEGLLAMRDAGAETIGQSEGTCVVYGMPRSAVEIGAVRHVVDIDRLAQRVVQLVGG